jgi:hypothetical protein
MKYLLLIFKSKMPYRKSNSIQMRSVSRPEV